MLSIKLQRIGRRHQPSYRVVVAEARSKLVGPPVEDLGSYNPFSKSFAVKGERVSYWLGQGAQATTTVHNLLAKAGIISAKPRKLAMPAKEVQPEPEIVAPSLAVAEPEAPQEEPSSEAAPEPAEESSEEPAAAEAES